MLTEKHVKQLHDQLLEHQQELRNLLEMNKDGGNTVELDQSRVGRLSRMDALQGQAMNLERERRRALELNNINAALQRMELGDYGLCTECGKDIALPRLQLDPAVRMCIDCASASEKE